MASNVIDLVLKLKDAASGPMKEVAAESKRLAAETDNASKKFRISGKMMLGMGVAAVGTAAALGAMVKGLADSRNELIDTATKTGLTTETIAGLRLAAEGSGLQLANLATGLVQLPKRMDDVARGTGEAKIAFEQLGISVLDANGDLRSSDAVLKESLESLMNVEGATKQSALATQLFGEAGTGLLQALSGTELDEFVAQAKKFGVSVGPNAAKAAGDLQRELANFGLVSEKAMENLLASLGSKSGGAAHGMKVLTATMLGMSEMFKNVMDVGRRSFAVITNTVTDLFMAIMDLGKALGDVFAGNFEKASERASVAIKKLKFGLKQTMTEAADLFAEGGLVGAVERAVATGMAAMEATAGTAGTGAKGPATQLIAASEAGEKGESKGPSDAQKAFDQSSKAFSQSVKSMRLAMNPATSKSEEMRRALADLQTQMAHAEAQAAALGPEAVEAFAKTKLAALGTMGEIGRGIQAQLDIEEKARKAAALGDVAGGISMVTAGPGAALEAAGPAGSIVSAISALGEMGAEGIKTMITDFIDGFIMALVEVIPELIVAIPEILIEALPEILGGLLKALPKILIAIIWKLPKVLAIGTYRALSKIWSTIRKYLGKFLDAINPFQTGGIVRKSGIHMLHAGERIVPTSGASTQAVMAGASNISSGQSVNISTNVVDPNAIDGLARMLQRELGSFGGGRDLSASNCRPR